MSTNREEIIKVEVLDSRELQLVLSSGGKAMYQHIYREAKGVNWDNDAGAFKGKEQIKWTYSEWFTHILTVCADASIVLKLANNVEWVNVPESDKTAILAACSS
jgi:hypothetical protein